jgi:hypothetical protein
MVASGQASDCNQRQLVKDRRGSCQVVLDEVGSTMAVVYSQASFHERKVDDMDYIQVWGTQEDMFRDALIIPKLQMANVCLELNV